MLLQEERKAKFLMVVTEFGDAGSNVDDMCDQLIMNSHQGAVLEGGSPAWNAVGWGGWLHIL